jgi:hypothetical protein
LNLQIKAKNNNKDAKKNIDYKSEEHYEKVMIGDQSTKANHNKYSYEGEDEEDDGQLFGDQDDYNNNEKEDESSGNQSNLSNDSSS